MNLADVMQALYASEIDCSIGAVWDDGWDVQLERGRLATARVDSLDAAARWLHEQAIARLPESDYAKQRQPSRSSRAEGARAQSASRAHSMHDSTGQETRWR